MTPRGLPVAILERDVGFTGRFHATQWHPKAVEDGVTGLLVAEYNVNHMAAVMAELLNDPGRAAAMGEVGRSRVLGNFTEKARDYRRAIMGLPPLPTADAWAA